MSFIPEYILILGFTILIDYFAGIFIENAKKEKKKFFLILSLVANIGVLFIFKYYNFFTEQWNEFTQQSESGLQISNLNIILPIGLSFHTFQAMSYTIEVYRGHQKAERHIGIYALYVMFFPQLVAGPIERPQNLIHQFYEKHLLKFDKFKEGVTLIVFGLFKKVVIADRLSVVVDHAFSEPSAQSGMSLLIASFFYSFQIYCDFSAYSEIAIGSALVLGFTLMDNFRSPYFASSLSEFWKRWHISLSSWFKDYLYISLGGNRVSKINLYRNILIVFILSGIWHGANYTFLVWGLAHGIFLCLMLLWRQIQPTSLLKHDSNIFKKTFSILSTFTFVCLSWVLFRAQTIGDAGIIYSKIFSKDYFRTIELGLATTELIFCFALIILLCFKDYFLPKISTKSTYVFLGINIALLIVAYFFGIFNLKQFIYFQF